MLAVTVVAGLEGCAAIPLAVVAGALFEAGGSVVVKTGTEYSSGGTVRRTFNVPVDAVHGAVVETFRRTQVLIVREEVSPKRRKIAARVMGRKVRVQLIPLTPVLTTMQLDVTQHLFASDEATASELLAQIERTLAARTDVTLRGDGTAARDPSLQSPLPDPTPTPAPRRRKRCR